MKRTHTDRLMAFSQRVGDHILAIGADYDARMIADPPNARLLRIEAVRLLRDPQPCPDWPDEQQAAFREYVKLIASRLGVPPETLPEINCSPLS